MGPQPILRLTALLSWLTDDRYDTDEPIRTARVGRIHAEALGPGRRKRVGHFELRDERDVLDWLQLHGLTLFTPGAHAVLRSIREDGLLDDPPRGKRYSVYAMLPANQIIAVVRHDTELGDKVVRGQIELPYDDEGVAAAACITDPIARIRAAATLDALAARSLLIETVQL